jgi:hypothetical protein
VTEEAAEQAPVKPRRKRKAKPQAFGPVVVSKVAVPPPALMAAALAVAGGDRSRITVKRPGYLEVDRTGLGPLFVPSDPE